MNLKKELQKTQKELNDESKPKLATAKYFFKNTTSANHAEYVGKKYAVDGKLKEGGAAIFITEDESTSFAIYPVDSVIDVEECLTLAIISGSKEFVFKY